jgi:hypothetical protein
MLVCGTNGLFKRTVSVFRAKIYRSLHRVTTQKNKIVLLTAVITLDPHKRPHSQLKSRNSLLNAWNSQSLHLHNWFVYVNHKRFDTIKAKAVPLHATEALERGELLLILDLGTRWDWVVSITPRPRFSPGKGPRYPLYRRLGGPQSRSGHRLEEKSFRLCQGSHLDRPAVQPIARCYPAHFDVIRKRNYPTRLGICVVLAIGPIVRGNKPGRARWVFKGEKIPRTSSFGGEIKPSAQCHKILQHVKPLKPRGDYMYRLSTSQWRCILYSWVSCDS